jgi:Rrf2 family protein
MLAREHDKGPILIVDIAEKELIPRKFLELILLELKKHGLLQSKKGKGGGYFLAKPPESITLSQVIGFMDVPIALVPCVSQTAYMKCDDCEDEATYGIRIVMKEVRDKMGRILDGTTLAGVLKQVQARTKTIKTWIGGQKWNCLSTSEGSMSFGKGQFEA